MKKVISVFIAVVMAVSCAALSFPASAATNCFSIKISGTQNNSLAKSTVAEINTKRAENGLDALTVDAELEAFAQKRAAEIMLGGKAYTDDNGNYVELCSDRTAMDSIFRGYGKSVFSAYTDDKADFTEAVSLLSGDGYAAVKKIGIASFTFEKITSYYIIFSTDASESAYTDFTDKAYSANINVHYSFVPYFKFYNTAVDTRYFKHSVKGTFSGYYKDYLVIPNSQLVYKSTKPSVYKTVGYNGYVKGNGAYNIRLYDTNNVALCTFENLSAKINLTAPNTYVASKKKKQLYVQWQTFTDCSGYEIQYSLKKNMKGAKKITVKGAKKNKYTIKKKLKSKKKYYVRVRAYKNQGGGEKVYTKWSKKKAVKIK